MSKILKEQRNRLSPPVIKNNTEPLKYNMVSAVRAIKCTWEVAPQKIGSIQRIVKFEDKH